MGLCPEAAMSAAVKRAHRLAAVDPDSLAIGVFSQHAHDCCWSIKKPVKGNRIELFIPGHESRYTCAFVDVKDGQLHLFWVEYLYAIGVKVLVLNSNTHLRRMERTRG
jgi:hypothetical protein